MPSCRNFFKCGIEATEVSYGEVKVGVMTNQYYSLGALPATRKSFARVFPGFVQNVGLGVTSEVQKILEMMMISKMPELIFNKSLLLDMSYTRGERGGPEGERTKTQ